MSRKPTRGKKVRTRLVLVLVIMVVVLTLASIGSLSGSLLAGLKKAAGEVSSTLSGILEQEKAGTSSGKKVEELTQTSDMLVCQFIDVGQADCTLISSGQYAMLIDGGNHEDGPLVADYLAAIGIDHLDYLICTHGHEDHCGGLDAILDALPVATILLPRTPGATWFYDNFLEAVDRESAVVVTPDPGDEYTIGSASWTVLACRECSEENLNESSIVITLSFGDVSFLFPGDAEEINETEILEAGYGVDVDILKAGHHGSWTSNSQAWLEATTPELVVISVGRENEYGLPNEGVLRRMERAGAEILRTDTDGTVVIRTDGSSYTVSCTATNTDGEPRDHSDS